MSRGYFSFRNIWGQTFPENRRLGETEIRRNDCFADEKIAAVSNQKKPAETLDFVECQAERREIGNGGLTL